MSAYCITALERAKLKGMADQLDLSQDEVEALQGALINTYKHRIYVMDPESLLYEAFESGTLLK